MSKKREYPKWGDKFDDNGKSKTYEDKLKEELLILKGKKEIKPGNYSKEIAKLDFWKTKNSQLQALELK